MKPRVVNGRYDLVVPDHVAEWDAPSSWERARFKSMEATLEPGMVLYDIGTEHGWISAIYAGFVGPENMVLVEPTPEFWPNIRRCWEHNDLDLPIATARTLLGPEHLEEPDLVERGWPSCADGPETGAGGYRYLHEPKHVLETPVTTLDHLIERVGVVPDAVTMDVEGAELEVLRGAVDVLTEYRPLVWVSVHPDLMARDYGADPVDLFAFMADHQYLGEHLGTDHEEHHLWTPQ